MSNYKSIIKKPFPNNTTDYLGQSIVSTYISVSSLYVLFDNNVSSSVSSGNTFPVYHGIKLPNPEIAQKVIYYTSSNGAGTPNKIEIQGFNGTDWVTIHTAENLPLLSARSKQEIEFPNSVEYIGYRIYAKDVSYIHNNVSRIEISELDFLKKLPPNKSLILHDGEHKKYNSKWETVSSTLPTQQQFLSDGMDSLSPLLDRRVEAFDPQPMTDKSEILQGGKGKVFSKTIDLKKYIDVRKIKTEGKPLNPSFQSLNLLRSNNKTYTITEEENKGQNLSKYVANITANGGTTPEKTIDGNTTLSQANSWYSVNLPNGWIKYEFNQPIQIDSIKILSAYYSGYEAIRNFQIEGSYTGDFAGEEVVMYVGMHPNDITHDFVTYNFTNGRKFKFYRINVSDIYFGNGNNNLGITEVEFYSNLIELVQIPKNSADNFAKYGKSNINLGGITTNKNYILQDGVSENADGLWVQEIDRKPLSIGIKFE